MLSNLDNPDGFEFSVSVSSMPPIDLPNELLVDIMECLLKEALLMLTKVSLRF